MTRDADVALTSQLRPNSRLRERRADQALGPMRKLQGNAVRMTDKPKTRASRALTVLAVCRRSACCLRAAAHADRIDNGVAVFSALDKVTARTSKFEVPLNSARRSSAR